MNGFLFVRQRFRQKWLVWADNFSKFGLLIKGAEQ
jgi:hypothetical protein